MYKPNKPHKTKMTGITLEEGETIEEKMVRIMNNKEPITDGAPIIHIPRSEGVRADTNIRTDRFEIAVDFTDQSSKAKLAQRDNLKVASKSEEPKGGDIAATGEQPQ